MPTIHRHQFIIAILFLLLAGAVWFNWILFKTAEYYYIQLNAVRMSPLGLHAFATETAVSPTDEQTLITLFGDSRAAQWPTQNNAKRLFINRGIGAQTSVQVAQRYDEHVAPLQPDILLLQVGINDLKTIGLFPKDAQMIVSTVTDNIDKIIAQATSEGSTVIVTTVFPVGDVPLERRIFWTSEIETAVIQTNDHIQTLASENVIVFDTFELLVDENGRLNEEYAADELHLNQAGYAMLNEALDTLLATHIINP